MSVAILARTCWDKGIGKRNSSARDPALLRTLVEGIRAAPAPELSSAIQELATQKCTLGLVLIAQIRAEVRIEAMRGLAQGSLQWDIHASEQVARVCGEVLSLADRTKNVNIGAQTVHLTPLTFEPHEGGRIAIEEKSVELGAHLLGTCLIVCDAGIYNPLVQLMIQNKRWNVLDSGATFMKPETIERLGAYVDEIARTPTRFVLSRIGAMHPERDVRMRAIRAIANGQVDHKPNVPYYLADVAHLSLFADTGRVAVDLMAMQAREIAKRPGPVGCPAGFWDAVGEGTMQTVLDYALDKMFAIWDTTQGYSVPSGWPMPSEHAKARIAQYLLDNFERLVGNGEVNALCWLSDRTPSRRTEIANALARFDIHPDHRWALQKITQDSTDPAARMAALMQLTEKAA